MNIFEKMYNEWFSLPAKTRFYVIAVANFVVAVALFALLVTFMGYHHYRLCVFLQWFIPSLIVYLVQRHFVFKTKEDIIYEYLKYSATWFLCFICNVAILELIVSLLTKNVYVAQLSAYTIVTILSYSLFKDLTFMKNK